MVGGPVGVWDGGCCWSGECKWSRDRGCGRKKGGKEGGKEEGRGKVLCEYSLQVNVSAWATSLSLAREPCSSTQHAQRAFGTSLCR